MNVALEREKRRYIHKRTYHLNVNRRLISRHVTYFSFRLKKSENEYDNKRKKNSNNKHLADVAYLCNRIKRCLCRVIPPNNYISNMSIINVHSTTFDTIKKRKFQVRMTLFFTKQKENADIYMRYIHSTRL